MNRSGSHALHMTGLRRCSSGICILVLVAIVLSGCAGTQQSDPPPSANLDDETLISLILKLREEPKLLQPAAILCAASLAAGQDEEFDYRSFFGALFEVSDADAGLTFCRSLVEAVVSGNMSEAELRAFESPEDVRDYTVFGKMMRELLLAHERLNTQEAMLSPRR